MYLNHRAAKSSGKVVCSKKVFEDFSKKPSTGNVVLKFFLTWVNLNAMELEDLLYSDSLDRHLLSEEHWTACSQIIKQDKFCLIEPDLILKVSEKAVRALRALIEDKFAKEDVLAGSETWDKVTNLLTSVIKDYMGNFEEVSLENFPYFPFLSELKESLCELKALYNINRDGETRCDQINRDLSSIICLIEKISEKIFESFPERFYL